MDFGTDEFSRWRDEVDALEDAPALSDVEINAALAARIPLTQRAAANGVATLDSASKVPGVQLLLASLGLAINVHDHAATPAQRAVLGNSANKPLSGFYATLALAQAAYPHATALSDELDWAVIQAAWNASLSLPNSNPATTVRTAVLPVWLPTGIYLVNRPLTIKSVTGFHFYGSGDGSRIAPNGITATAVIDLDGLANCVFNDFLVLGNDTENVTHAVKLDWTTAALRSTSNVVFERLNIKNTRYVNGFAFGVDSANRQVDNITVRNCVVTGGWLAGNVTTYQRGVLIGSGSFGNILNYDILSCHVGSNRYNYNIKAVSPVNIIGGDMAGAEVDVLFENNGGIFHMEGQRSEGSGRLFSAPFLGSANSSVVLKSIVFAVNNLNADNRAVYYGHAGYLSIEGLRFSGIGSLTPHVYVDTASKVSVTCLGCTSNLPPNMFVQCSVVNRMQASFVGYLELVAGDLGTGTFHGIYVIQPDGDNRRGLVFGAGSAVDVNLYRSAADMLATDDDLLVNLAGKGLRVKEGANAKQGVATLVAGTVTVANTSVTANSRILLTVQSLGTVAAPKAVGVTARTAATSFVITSADATDTSVVAWEVFEPA